MLQLLASDYVLVLFLWLIEILINIIFSPIGISYDKFVMFKGAMKLYFMHYSCVVIILFSTGLSVSIFYLFFWKKYFFVFLRILRFLPVLCRIRRNLYNLIVL